MAKVEHFADQTIKFEAGYQAIPSDDGNYCYSWIGGKRVRGALIGTKYGISAQAYQQAYNACPTVAQMKNLTIPQAKYIFKKVFWDNLINGDKFRSQWVANLAFQAAIGSPARIKDVREAINLLLAENKQSPISTNPVKFTDAEISVINSLDSVKLFNSIYDHHYKKLQQINLTVYKGQMQGWFTRMKTIKDMAFKEYSEKLTKGTLAVHTW